MVMPRLIVSIDDAVVKEVALAKARTTLGRRPYNDIVFDNLAVSGEHAVLIAEDEGVSIEDLGSTNGTRVNGEAVGRRLLQDADIITIGKYKVTFLAELPQAERAPTAEPEDLELQEPGPALIKVISGRAAGREMALTKAVTTLGKPGVAVAAITRRPTGFVLHHVEGSDRAAVNGAPVGPDAVSLRDGDTIALAGTTMQFLQA
jgi:pSer/pThr/pTyr-binding forkhead associated (FHA) protein